MGCSQAFHYVSYKISNGFGRYGHFVGRHPIWFIVIPVLISAALAVGFMFREEESDIETLYTPMSSRSRDDRKRVKELFPDGTGNYYNPMSLSDHPLGGIVLFRPRNDTNVLTSELLAEIREFSKTVQQWRSNVSDGTFISYEEVCGRLDGKCLVWGDVVLRKEFWQAYQENTLTFPFWESPWGIVDLSVWLGNVNKTDMDVVVGAGAIKLIFTLRQDSESMKELSLRWEKDYVSKMQELQDDDFTHLLFAFSSSQSLGMELDKGTKGDIIYFSFTFTLMITFASIVSSGGDCVSTRALLANAGVVAAMMGIMGSFGLFSYVGLKFVNIVGVVPFLILGIGVDDMFLLMSGWSSTQGNTDLSVPERIAATFRSAGIGITITSLTDFLAFAIGSTSVFLSVRNFCIYSGVAVLFCYLFNVTFFAGCMTLHGRRVYSGRHTITCKQVRSRKDMSEEGEKCCTICMCGGTTPANDFDDESLFEKGPRLALPRLVLWTPFKVLVVLVFAGYIGISVWGVLEHLQQGLRLKDLVLRTSYYRRFNTWDEDNFGMVFPVAFVIPKPVDYTNPSIMQELMQLMHQAREDPDISPFGTYCWLTDYVFSPTMDVSSPENFVRSLRDDFLPEHTRYMSDVVFDDQNQSVVASRCHVLSKNVVESTKQAQLMIRMRDLADNCSLGIFAYQPAFVFFEQYVMIMRSTLQTVGITLAVMFVVTFLFLVHPTIVFLVFLNIVMIILGIFGFMGLWDLTLSSVTMIHLIMSVGFSVDFSAHVCSAYMLSSAATRNERAHYALVHASGPILNSGLSSLIGIVVLVFSDSYIFQSFFKIMLLVIGFGMLHAVFLIPVLLSWFGPLKKQKATETRSTDERKPSFTTNKSVSSLGYKKRDSTSEVTGETIGKDDLAMDSSTRQRPSLLDSLGYLGEDNKAFSAL